MNDEVREWHAAIKLSGKRQNKWEERAKKVIKRFRDEREDQARDYAGKRFNMLWSNTETLKPAVFARTPKSEVSRRYKDRDPVARQASMILERALQYHMDSYDFEGLCNQVVEDYLLPGRATAWAKYSPTYGPEQLQRIPLMEMQGVYLNDRGEQVGQESMQMDAIGPYMDGDPYTPVLDERAECEYVFWQDLRLGPGRNWKDLPWIARRAFMDKKSLTKRFGEKMANAVPLKYCPNDISKDDEYSNRREKKGEIWEIWDKENKKVRWIASGLETSYLEVSDPPLNFKNFWPCPPPLYSVKTNDSMIPIPEYCMYQDQAQEIDDLTARINILVNALRVAGVYAGSSDAVQQLLTTHSDNRLIPVDDWAAFAERGGIEGMISWLPIDQIINVVVQLYQAREQTKQEIYEITGIADLIRGASQAQETATAQRIKGQFATLRLSKRQDAVTNFIVELIRLKAEVICEMLSPETLQAMTGLEVTPEVMQLLRNDVLRDFKIDIETDSTLMPDEQADKQSRSEFLTAVTGFMGQLLPMAAQAPELGPLIGEMILFGVRGFRVGRQLEETIETALEEIQQKAAQAAQQPQQPPPDPRAIEAQARAQKVQQDIQLDQAKTQADIQMDQQRLQSDLSIAEREMELKRREAEFDMRIKALKTQAGG